MIHLTTLILLVWHEILKDLRMKVSCMPRDVVTRWNSLFNLLEYALKHWKAIDLVTQRCELGMRDLELSDNEWELVKQLCSVLKVSMQHVWLDLNTYNHRSSRMQHCSSRAPLPLSLRSFLPWTTLTWNSWHLHATRSFFCPFNPVSCLPRWPSIAIIPALISLRSIALQWVTIDFLAATLANLY